jgi:homoserine kinase
MALDLWNEVTVERGSFKFHVEGEGAKDLPLDTRNLVVTGVEAAFNLAEKEMPPLRYKCHNRIPHGRGLGSSSAAIVSGLVAGAALAEFDMTPHQALKLAADIEGHPDNVAPAIFGACIVGIHDNEQWIVDSVPLPEGLNTVVYIPDQVKNTNDLRARLPEQISRADAIFNIGRAAMLVNALAGDRLELLRAATQDRLHQPHRAQVFRGFDIIVRAALNGGAYGAFLSGAGPSVMAFARGREVTISYEMSEAARQAQVPGRCLILAPAARGAHVVEVS